MLSRKRIKSVLKDIGFLPMVQALKFYPNCIKIVIGMNKSLFLWALKFCFMIESTGYMDTICVGLGIKLHYCFGL